MSAGRMNPSLPGADRTSANRKIVREQMLRLLPVQILLTAVGAVNGFASSFFASNFVGVDAMTAVGLYSPVLMFLTSVISVLVIGSTMLCGLYMGKNEQENRQGVFTLDIAISIVAGLIFTGLFLVMGWFDLTGFITRDAAQAWSISP